MNNNLSPFEQALGKILDKVGQMVPGENEYLKDGIPFCKKCNTAKAVVVDKAQGLVMHSLCKCERERRAEEKRRQAEDDRRKQVEFLRRNSMLGEFFLGCTFSGLTITKYNQSAVEMARKYCFHADEMLRNGYGIYIYGDCGAGKTTLAACIANRLTEQCHTVWFTSLIEIINSVKSTFDTGRPTSYYDKITQVDFLFLDDIGTEGMKKDDNSWIQSTVFDIINRRYNAKKPVIFTGNYSVESLSAKANFAQRTAQRISEMGTLSLYLGHINMRLISEETNKSEIKKILE